MRAMVNTAHVVAGALAPTDKINGGKQAVSVKSRASVLRRYHVGARIGTAIQEPKRGTRA